MSMPTASGPRLSAQAGMTLVEIMVVVFIIGLASTMVVMTMPPRASDVAKSAQDFVDTVTQAQDRAILSGQPLGVRIGEDDTYSVLRWTGAEWSAVPNLTTNELPRGIQIALLSDQISEARPVERPKDWPQILLDPTGVSDPARLEFRQGAEVYEIYLEASGEVRINER